MTWVATLLAPVILSAYASDPVASKMDPSQKIMGGYYAPLQPAQTYLTEKRALWPSWESIRENLRLIADLGAPWVRTPIRWRAVEPTPGVVDFSQYDRFLEEVHQAGLRPILILGEDIPHHALDLPKAFREHCARCIARYAGYSPLWQLGNELDIGNKEIFRWPWPRVLAYLTAGIEGIKGVDPRARVVVNAACNFKDRSFKFFQFLHQGGLNPDYLGVDFYPLLPRGIVKRLQNVILELRQRFPQPVLVTEVGASAFLPRWSPFWSETSQARLAADVVERVASIPEVSGLIWFCLRDYRFLHPWFFTEERLGLVTLDGRLKPAYHALRQAIARW